MNETDKSKRKEKPKGAPRRKWLFASAIITLIVLVAGMFGLLAFTICSCSPGYTVFDETSTAISLTNARVAGLLTETQVASLMLTGGPPPDYYWTQTAAVGATGTAYEVNRQRSMTATATPDGSAEPSPPPGLTATRVCFWNRATQNDAEFAQRVQAALDEAGIEVVSVTVSAHGEDYICNEDGKQTKSFHPMDWSPVISIPETIGEPPAAMGARIEAVLRAIEAMNVGGLYRIDIIFASTGTESVLWRMDYKAALGALNFGMTGAALYETGRGG